MHPLDDLESRLRPLETEANLAWWEANTSSSDAAIARRQELDLAVRAILADSDAFAEVKSALARPDLDGAERRQLELVQAAMEPNQLDDETRQRLVELETAVEATYNRHRGQIDGRRVADNEIAEILATSDDVALRRAAWEASKTVGRAAAADLLELVTVRNDVARRLGHRDHYAMSLTLTELDEDRLFAVLDELDRATEDSFASWKARDDEERAKRFGCAADELRPWHQDDVFFQEPPRARGLGLDELLAGTDIAALARQTYDGLGIDLRPVLDRSDLYPREGKSQHAFCIDIDRSGDVRVLANVVPNERWAGTMLHELGHAAYDRCLDVALPWFLRQPAHMLTTEAVAMLFGRLVRDPAWLQAVVEVPAAEADRLADRADEAQRAGMLVFARWVLVMCHFERGLYQDPAADHDTRWWDLVERFQRVRRPDGRTAPDWAAKIHLAVAPVYYQNYLYGELLASQLDEAIRSRCGGLVGQPVAGAWLIEQVFAPGASLRWDHLVTRATGTPLGVGAFARQFAG